MSNHTVDGECSLFMAAGCSTEVIDDMGSFAKLFNVFSTSIHQEESIYFHRV